MSGYAPVSFRVPGTSHGVHGVRTGTRGCRVPHAGRRIVKRDRTARIGGQFHYRRRSRIIAQLLFTQQTLSALRCENLLRAADAFLGVCESEAELGMGAKGKGGNAPPSI